MTLNKDLTLLTSRKRKSFSLYPLGTFQYKGVVWEYTCQWRASQGGNEEWVNGDGKEVRGAMGQDI